MSAARQPSAAFDRLAEPIRRWVWRQGWTALRDIQDAAIDPILAGRDLVIASATASGKTEAAFLPVLSRAATGPLPGLRVLYVSPLKALINDQTRRLQDMADAVDLPVTPWHGDVAATRKQRLLARPSGVLLITPESLEAHFVLRGSRVSEFFAGLDYIVVDELHSFIGNERGRQLQSLLHRAELAIGRRVPRVGLSATLGDLGVAARFLRPGGAEPPTVVSSDVARRELRVQVRAYERPAADDDEDDTPDTAAAAVAAHLGRVAADGTHLVFANRRSDVEEYVDRLRTAASESGRVAAVLPHHGSLAKDLREEAEAALRDDRAATVIATTTLELGIDVGSVDSIGQIGAPASVASLRQRLGRSGRRPGAPSVLRVYIIEDEVTATSPPQAQLRDSLVQAVAMLDLLVDRFNEAPRAGALHLSTLVQQVLSIAAQRGGFRADDAWRALCATGPFDVVDGGQFGRLLRDLARHDLLVQMHDGTIVLGGEGERLVNHFDFYSAFLTSDEWSLRSEARTLGTLPISRPVAQGDLMLFAGRRWRVRDVRDEERIIELEPAPAGRAPSFGGSGALIDGAVRRRMLSVYGDVDDRAFLDAGARRLLASAREAFRRLELDERRVLAWGADVVVFPWCGDREADTLALMLRQAGLDAARDGVAVLVIAARADEVSDALRNIAEASPDPGAIVADIETMSTEKHHRFLSTDLLRADYVASRLDIDGAVVAAGGCLDE